MTIHMMCGSLDNSEKANTVPVSGTIVYKLNVMTAMINRISYYAIHIHDKLIIHCCSIIDNAL